MQIPSKDDWLEIAKSIVVAGNFPHRVGAVDGKHISVSKPMRSGLIFLNYKHFFSIVLMAVADSH